MPLQAFTRNYEDLRTEEGFRFNFKCDICGDGYTTSFVASKSAKRRGLFNKVSQFGGYVSSNAGLAGVLGGRAQHTPEWEKEHEQAFQAATNEAMPHFHRCPRCYKYVCDADWNEEMGGLCVEDAPKIASEVGAAKASATKDQIWEKAKSATLYTGELKEQQTVCPNCGKTSGGGKFCNNCGAPLGMKKCLKCGADNNPSVNFCGNCGNRL